MGVSHLGRARDTEGRHRAVRPDLDPEPALGSRPRGAVSSTQARRVYYRPTPSSKSRPRRRAPVFAGRISWRSVSFVTFAFNSSSVLPAPSDLERTLHLVARSGRLYRRAQALPMTAFGDFAATGPVPNRVPASADRPDAGKPADSRARSRRQIGSTLSVTGRVRGLRRFSVRMLHGRSLL
jgi:hypothetical protein